MPPRQRPGIRARLPFAAAARGEKHAHLRRVARRQQVAPRRVHLPGSGQRAEHVQPGENGIDGRPRARLVAEQGELERQAVSVAIDVEVDAARVGRERSAVAGRRRPVALLGQPPHAEAARLAVWLDARRPDDFGQVAGRHPAQAVHLPHAILRGGVALREQRVLQRACGDVRHAQFISRDGDRGGHGRLHRARRARQRAVCEPIYEGEQDRGERRPCRRRASAKACPATVSFPE